MEEPVVGRRQTHTVHMVYEGSAEELLSYFAEKGIKMEVALSGLVNSDTVVIVEKEQNEQST